MSASPEQFKAVLSRWASGVSVVTTNDDGMLYGLTVSSFSSVSLDPPLVSVCLSEGNRLVEMIKQSGKFAVSILGANQQAASQYFARPQRLPTPNFTEIEGPGSIWSCRWWPALSAGSPAPCTKRSRKAITPSWWGGWRPAAPEARATRSSTTTADIARSRKPGWSVHHAEHQRVRDRAGAFVGWASWSRR